MHVYVNLGAPIVKLYQLRSLVLKYRKLTLAPATSAAGQIAATEEASSEVSTAVSLNDSASSAAKTDKINAIFLRLKQQKLKKTPDDMQNKFVVPPSVLRLETSTSRSIH